MRRLSAVGIALVALSLLALAPSAVGRGTAADSWTGSWTSEWGTMTLTQSASKLEGKYPHDNGHIVGVVSGNIFTGRWDEVPTRKGPGDAGAVILTLAADGKSFTGKWNYDADPNGWATNWNGRCNAGACLRNSGHPARRACTKMYVIEPSGAKIVASLKLVDYTAEQKAAIVKKETARYEGFPYTPIGAVTRTQNCAGYVMARLFGSKMVDANVEPDGFVRTLVMPYGSKRLGRLTARAGDVVVYRTAEGTVRHVAIVDSNLGRLRILTKDGNERPYRATFPLSPLNLSNDPLVKAHTESGAGTVEFWSVDRSKVSIRAVSTDQCDD